jgi:hypothetical protein
VINLLKKKMIRETGEAIQEAAVFGAALAEAADKAAQTGKNMHKNPSKMASSK